MFKLRLPVIGQCHDQSEQSLSSAETAPSHHPAQPTSTIQRKKKEKFSLHRQSVLIGRQILVAPLNISLSAMQDQIVRHEVFLGAKVCLRLILYTLYES